MKSLSLRRSFGVLFVTGLALIWAPGCGKQNEGERCDYARNGDEDCESGLVCTPKQDLIGGTTDRCCPASGNANDDRCLPNTGVGGKDGGTGGAAGAAGAGGAAGAAGVDGAAGGGGTAGSAGDGGGDAGAGGTDASSDGGLTCKYSSECPGALVCGPTGVCQVECLGDGGKDCPTGEVCVSGVCQPVPPPDSGSD